MAEAKDKDVELLFTEVLKPEQKEVLCLLRTFCQGRWQPTEGNGFGLYLKWLDGRSQGFELCQRLPRRKIGTNAAHSR